MRYEKSTASFERDYPEEMVREQTAGEQTKLIRNALEFIERTSESAGLNMDHVNNATVTVIRTAMLMRDEIGRLQEQLTDLRKSVS